MNTKPSIISKLLGKLPKRFQWTFHNVIAHPLSELLWLVGLHRWSDIVHDSSIPAHEPGEGRG